MAFLGYMACLPCNIPIRGEIQYLYRGLRVDVRLGRLDFHGAVLILADHSMERQLEFSVHFNDSQ